MMRKEWKTEGQTVGCEFVWEIQHKCQAWLSKEAKRTHDNTGLVVLDTGLCYLYELARQEYDFAFIRQCARLYFAPLTVAYRGHSASVAAHCILAHFGCRGLWDEDDKPLTWLGANEL